MRGFGADFHAALWVSRPDGRVPAAADSMPKSGHENSTLPRWRARLAHLATALFVSMNIVMALGAGKAQAQNATWNGPGVEWTTATNWLPANIPLGVATFTNNGAPTSLTISNSTQLGEIVFNAGAPAYSFSIGATTTFDVAGIGITNNSAFAPGFTNNGTFNFDSTAMAGNANITNTSSGTLNFNGTATAENATITNNAGSNVIFNNAATAGNATIGNGGFLIFYNTSTAGSAAITNNDFAVLKLENTATAGSAIISNSLGSYVNLYNSSTAGNATITNNSGSVIQFYDTATAGNAIITNNNTGYVVFDNSSTAGNATITNNFGLQFYNNSTAGNARIVNNAGGVADFSASTGPNNDGKLSAGSIEGAGNFLLGSNQLTVGSNNLSTTVSGVISDCGAGGTACDQYAATFVTPTGGSLVKVGTGTLTLSGANTYTGPTYVNSGTLSLAHATGGVIDAASSNFIDLNGGALQFAASGTFSNEIDFTAPTVTITATTSKVATLTGSFEFNQSNAAAVFGSATDTGTIIFAPSFIGGNPLGTLEVAGGTLEVDGSIGSTGLTTVDSGATLRGVGTVGNTTIAGGGMFNPGNGTPGSSMTVTGNLAFQSGAVYLVQINPTTASFAAVAGTATLSGATVNATYASGSYLSKQYTILTTTGGLGGTTFAGLTNTNLPAGFTASLNYSTPDDVMLDLNGALGGPGTGGLNVNQQNVANGLSNFFNGGGTLTPSFLNIFGLTGGNLANALTQIDGEAATGAEKGAFQMMTQFLGVMLDPFANGRGGNGGGQAMNFAPDQQASLPPDIALAYASALKEPPAEAFAQRWTAWGSSFGGYNKTNGDPTVGSNTVTARDYGFAAGMDYHLTPETVYGFALAGGGTNWGLAQGLGGGRSDAFQAGVYGTTRFGPAYLAAALAFTNNWMTTSRTALGDQLNARFDAQSYGGRVETGYRYAVQPTIGVTPYAALQAQSFHTPNYSETDLSGGGFGLTYNAMNATDTRSEFGTRFDSLTALGDMPLVLRARVAWAHDWVSNPSLDAVFQSLPGASFIVNGAAPPANSALATAAAELQMTANWSLLAKFDGEFAAGSQTYAGTGTLRYTW
jgi:autotransporter-associated beta strand protein